MGKLEDFRDAGKPMPLEKSYRFTGPTSGESV